MAYLSDDIDARLRETAPPPCRRCRLFWAKHSIFLDQPVLGCAKPNLTAPNGELLSSVLLRLAEVQGTCPEADPFEESASAPGECADGQEARLR